MPLYFVTLGACSVEQVDRARRVATHRFPEISFERVETTTGDAPTATALLLRAPSPTHLSRLAAATDLVMTSIRPLEAPRNQGEPQ